MTVTQGGATQVTGLSRREVEIVDLLAKGRPVEEIAVTLGMSPSTVSTHIRRAKNKLKVSTTMELAVQWALRKAMPELEYQSWARTL